MAVMWSTTLVVVLSKANWMFIWFRIPMTMSDGWRQLISTTLDQIIVSRSYLFHVLMYMYICVVCVNLDHMDTDFWGGVVWFLVLEGVGGVCGECFGLSCGIVATWSKQEVCVCGDGKLYELWWFPGLITVQLDLNEWELGLVFILIFEFVQCMRVMISV